MSHFVLPHVWGSNVSNGWDLPSQETVDLSSEDYLVEDEYLEGGFMMNSHSSVSDGVIETLPKATLRGKGDPITPTPPSGSRNVSIEDMEIPAGTLHSVLSDFVEELPIGVLCESAGVPLGTSPLYDSYKYRTRNGNGIYEYRYVWNDKKKHYEIDIIQTPPGKGGKEDSIAAHWNPSPRGGKCICVSRGQEPKTLKKAQSLSVAYSELYQESIETGVSIDDIVTRNHPAKSLFAEFKNTFRRIFKFNLSSN